MLVLPVKGAGSIFTQSCLSHPIGRRAGGAHCGLQGHQDDLCWGELGPLPLALAPTERLLQRWAAGYSPFQAPSTPGYEGRP